MQSKICFGRSQTYAGDLQQVNLFTKKQLNGIQKSDLDLLDTLRFATAPQEIASQQKITFANI